MTTSDMTTILEDLAAGRIDPAEAARRIDAIKSPSTDSAVPGAPAAGGPAESSTPAHEGDATTAPAPPDVDRSPIEKQPVGQEPVADDAWAAATDRPQTAGVRREEVVVQPAEASTESTEPFGQPEPPVRPRPINAKGVERISVRAVGRRVRIVGEPAVATVAADGPHVLRRNGSVLEISSDGELGASLDGFTLLRAPRTLDDFRALGLGKELFLRVNPGILVDVEVTAGSLNTEGVPLLGKVRVTAGGAKLLDVEEVSDALVQAGSATVKGALRTGRSRIRAESGSLNITLADDSNVTVHGDAQLGRISWSGGHSGAGDEVVMGNGAARLDVEVVMGHAQVRVGSQPATSGAA